MSKKILEKIINIVREKTKFNQWKNTKSVIDWFENLTDKKKLKFIQFDICEFYPSISENLLIEALNFAETFVHISDDERKIILQAKQSLLFDQDNPWVKKGNSIFNVGMGSYDSAETCDLVGLYLLSKLQHLKVNLGLYRDDGLGVCALTNRQVDIIKKEICKIFEKHNLRITIEVNKKVVDFLDVTFNLDTGDFKPFMKPNDTPLYVNRNSNHPPSIIKNLPAGINKRLSSISATEGVFKNAIPPYQEALENSGYQTALKFETDASNTSRRRNRSAI